MMMKTIMVVMVMMMLKGEGRGGGKIINNYWRRLSKIS